MVYTDSLIACRYLGAQLYCAVYSHKYYCVVVDKVREKSELCLDDVFEQTTLVADFVID